MLLQNLIWAISLYTSTLLMGFISWPVTSIFFGKFSEKGYGVAKIFGWIVVSYVLLLVGTLRIMSLSYLTISGIVVIWLIINILVFRKRPITLTGSGVAHVALCEIIFLFLFCFFAFIKSHAPELHQIERFMDFGFIQSLANSRFLPPADMWMAGKTVNYYYFGHLLAYVIITFSRIPPEPGFFLVEVFQFGTIGLMVFTISFELMVLLRSESTRMAKIGAGLLSIFAVLFAGNWDSALWFIKDKLNISQTGFWYPYPTRIIPGTITEMPLYSFFVAELHAHTWGLINGLLIIAALYIFWSDRRKGWRTALEFIPLLGFELAIAYMTNSWDVITLGSLICVVFAVKFRKYFSYLLFFVPAIFALGAIFSLPWQLFFHSPLAGFDFVKTTSPFSQWFLFWGAWVSLSVVFLVHVVWKRKETGSGQIFFVVIIFLIAWLLSFMETIYFKDVLAGGTNFRANTVFKISFQVWLWAGLICGPIIIYLIASAKRIAIKFIWIISLTVFIFSLSIYPVKTIYQAGVENKKLTGLQAGLDWFKEAYPDDFGAYLFLKDRRDRLPQNDRLRNILEADGDSYSDSSIFSTFLGWPTVSGWAVHEWTWRGSYEETGKRTEEVRQAYVGGDSQLIAQVIRKYKISYIIIGSTEKRKYGDSLKRPLLEKFGKIIFRQNETEVLEVAPQYL